MGRREEGNVGEGGKVSAVLFGMDGVLCNSEEPSRMAAVDAFAEMGVSVAADDFVPFMGTGEANFLGGVASAKGAADFDPEAAKKRFFEIYLDKLKQVANLSHLLDAHLRTHMLLSSRSS